MSENVLKGDKTSIESISYLEVYLSLTSSQSSVKILTRNRILLSPPRPAELEVSLIKIVIQPRKRYRAREHATNM